MSVAILVPVLGRPHRVRPLLESIEAATPDPHRVLFIASPGDVEEHEAVRDAGGDLLVVDWEPGPGDYARKINAGYRHTSDELLFLAADDLHFHPGWLEAATAELADGVHVVGTDDMGNPDVMKGLHSTHTLVTRVYCDQVGTLDRRGQVLVECYPHEFVDNELVATAQARNTWAFAAAAKVEHLHPHWGKADTDVLYDAQPDRMRAGRRVWQRRQPLIRRESRRWAGRHPELEPDPGAGKVTVITASLPGRAHLLAEAIASVAAQTVPAAHLIAVDAGHGVAEVRNQLVAAATSEWVAFLDDDDLLDPNHLETLLAHAAGHDVVIPHCRFDGPPLPEQFCNRPFDRQTLRRHGIFPITVLARRQAVLDAGGFPTEGWDDWELWKRMDRRRARFTVVAETTWTYRTSTPDRRTHLLHAASA